MENSETLREKAYSYLYDSKTGDEIYENSSEEKMQGFRYLFLSALLETPYTNCESSDLICSLSSDPTNIFKIYEISPIIAINDVLHGWNTQLLQKIKL